MRIEVHGGVVDTTARRVVGPAGEVALREKEARLLEVLAEGQGAVVGRASLLASVFGYRATTRTRTLVTTVARTREALTRAGLSAELLQTVYGEGYRLLGRDPDGDRGCLGRADELAQLRRWLDDPACRLVSVVGAPGQGSSALVGAALEGRSVRKIRLDRGGGGSPAFAVAQALGAGAAGAIPFALHRTPGQLLWLDDVDDGVVELRARLLQWLGASTTLRVVLSGRRPLLLDGERLLRVGPLAPDAARALAARHLPASAEVSAAQLAATCGGSPLAIRVAAAAPGVGLELLQAVATAPSGEPSEVALARALRLLPAAWLRGLAQACALPAPFSLEAWAAVVQAVELPPGALLERLLETQLIVRSGAQRFRVVSALRGLLDDDPDAARRFLHHQVARGERLEVEPGGRLDAVDVLHALQLAVTLGEAEAGAALSTAALPWFERAQAPELIESSIQAIAALELSAVGRARIAIALAWIGRLRDAEAALAASEQAVARARHTRDDLLIARALEQRAQARIAIGRSQPWGEDLDEATSRHRWAGRLEGVVAAGLVRASAWVRAGQPERALTALEPIAGDVIGASFEARFRYLQVRAGALFERARWEAGSRAAHQLLELAEAEGTPEHLAWACLEAGFASALNIRMDEAEARMARGLASARQAWLVVRLMCNLMGLRARNRDWVGAAALLDETVAVARLAGGRAERLAYLRGAWLSRLAGDLTRAAALGRQATAEDASHLPDLTEVALLAAQRGELDEARRAQQQLVDTLAGSGRVAERDRAVYLLAELSLASGDLRAAEQLLAPHERDDRVQPYERPRLAALLCAARGEPPPEVEGPDPLGALDLACWGAVAHRQRGEHPAADRLLARVEQAMAEDHLPPESELGWRLAVAQRVSPRSTQVRRRGQR